MKPGAIVIDVGIIASPATRPTRRASRRRVSWAMSPMRRPQRRGRNHAGTRRRRPNDHRHADDEHVLAARRVTDLLGRSGAAGRRRGGLRPDHSTNRLTF